MLQGIENECLQMENTISDLASECQEMQDNIKRAINRLDTLKYNMNMSREQELDERIAMYEEIETIIGILKLKEDQ